MLFRLLCFSGLLLTFINYAECKKEDSPSHVLTIELEDTRLIPDDLLPVLVNYTKTGGGVGGDILPFTSGQKPDYWVKDFLKPLQKIADTVFVTTGPVERDNLWLMIEHPGYLRGFTTKIPILSDSASTVTLKMPRRGYLRTKLDLHEHVPYEKKEEVMDGFCIASSLRPQKREGYDMSFKHPIGGWELNVDDLAPGVYTLHSTMRHCDYGGGSAGYVGKEDFTIKPDCFTELKFPMFPRNDPRSKNVKSQVEYRDFQY